MDEYIAELENILRFIQSLPKLCNNLEEERQRLEKKLPITILDMQNFQYELEYGDDL